MLAALACANSAYVAPHCRSAPRISRRTQQPLAVAPSGIDALPDTLQQAAFASTYAGLGVAAFASATAYESAREKSSSVWWDRWETWSAFSLGVTLLFAGRSHFTQPEAFKAIYPPIGTWGFWALPGSSDFHVAWTGVAEILGGAGLLASCAQRVASAPSELPRLLPSAARAALLLILTVTPANIYMFTHGAIMPGVIEGELPLNWHAGRFIAQAIVLSVLLTLSELGPASGREEPAPDAAPRRAGSGVRMQLSDDEIDAKLRAFGEVEPPRARRATAAGRRGWDSKSWRRSPPWSCWRSSCLRELRFDLSFKTSSSR